MIFRANNKILLIKELCKEKKIYKFTKDLSISICISLFIFKVNYSLLSSTTIKLPA